MMVIGKIIPRKYGTGSFRDSVNYNLGRSKGETDKVEYVNTLNLFAPEVAAAEMQALALENTRSADPVFNCVLSWRENEIPTREQADGAVEIVLRELGLEGCQAHYALHRNTENLHLHLCVNRIDPETYKARNPAQGWTKKALEKAARKIELAQGWAIERSGRYVVTEDGEILEKIRDAGEVKLSQTARDIEAHTATKSAERIAQETAAPIVRAAQSWKELHERLAEKGIRFDRKGSGAVLAVGDTFVKASQAGRDIGLSKLEKRLGAYRERDASVTVRSINPEAVEKVESKLKVRGAWDRYRKAKEEYFAVKKVALAELKTRHGNERKTLTSEQRRERASLLSVSWRGKGTELNRHRSVMAANQQMEKLDLRDRQREECELLKKQFLQRFPSFKAWLNREDDPELSVLFRYSGAPVLLPAEDHNTTLNPGNVPDLRAYSPIIGTGQRGVMYRRNGKNTADFIDYGRKIVFPGKHDEKSVLAALQLASQKWGVVRLGGSEEYRRLCARLAAAHNIRIANPELREEVSPRVGQRVTFHVRNAKATLTGEVVALDNTRGTVTLCVGKKLVPIVSKKGFFTEAERGHVEPPERKRNDRGWGR